jgi:hypothetical protein
VYVVFASLGMSLMPCLYDIDRYDASMYFASLDVGLPQVQYVIVLIVNGF